MGQFSCILARYVHPVSLPVYLLGQASPSPILVQSGGAQVRNTPQPGHLALLLFSTVSVPPNLSRAEGPSPQLALLYLKASPKQRKPFRDARRQQPAAFQRLGFLTERSLQSIFLLRQKKQTYPASHGGRSDCANMGMTVTSVL